MNEMFAFSLESIMWSLLVLAVGVILLAASRAFLKLLYTKAHEAEIQKASKEWLLARTLLVDLVQAAQQMGKVGILPNDGEQKKIFVIETIESLLCKAKINIELDAVAALLEAVYAKQFGNLFDDIMRDEEDGITPPPAIILPPPPAE
jgi:hypothetical protein